MGKGEQVPEVHFSPDVLKELRDILGNGDGAAGIIRSLEEIKAVVPLLAAPNMKALREQLKTQRLAARAARLALGGGNLVENLLGNELTRRGWDARTFLANLRTGLVELEDVITAIEARTGRRRGGRPADSAAGWFVGETERALQDAGVPVTHEIGGTFARILEALWKPVLGRDAPLQLFNTLKSRR